MSSSLNQQVTVTKKAVFENMLREGIADEIELEWFVTEILGFRVPKEVYTIGHTSPFQLLKEMFFENVKRGIVMASRSSSKTRTVSVINFLDMLFKGVEVGLIAATLPQADKGYRYLLEYLKSPFIKPYVIKALKSETLLRNGGLTEIHTGTMTGMNAAHPCKLSIDEVELIDYPILEEGFSMTTSQRGRSTRDLLISTRKQTKGTMQRLLDEADKSNTKIYKWNIFDVLKRCERQCFGDKVHGDCLAWERCQGKAHDVPEGGFYPIEDFIMKASTLSEYNWKMQWLCQKASEARLVYGEEYFLEDVNSITWKEFLVKNNIDPGGRLDNKNRVIPDKVNWSEFKHFGGIDFGTVFCYHHFVENVRTKDVFVIWEYYVSESRILSEHASNIIRNPYSNQSEIFWRYCDPSGKQESLELEHHGVRGLCPANNSRKAGVDVVRHGFKSRKLYVITIECPNFLREKESYSFPTDQSGNVVGDEPEKGDDHACDSLRYGYYGYRLNLFPKEYGSLSTSRVPWLR